MEENIVLRNVSGTKGGAHPVLLSHITSKSLLGTGILDNFKLWSYLEEAAGIVGPFSIPPHNIGIPHIGPAREH